MFRDINKLSKRAVQLDREYELVNPKCKIKLRRILRRALSVEKKLMKAIGQAMPNLRPAEIVDMGRKQLAWMQERMTARLGRITQNPVSRTERRLKLREALNV